jgi:hypothetical protein
VCGGRDEVKGKRKKVMRIKGRKNVGREGKYIRMVQREPSALILHYFRRCINT